MDGDRFGEAIDVQHLFLEPGEAVERAVAGVSVLAEPLAEGKAQEMGGLHQGMQSESVEASAFHGGSEQTVEEGRGGVHELWATQPGG